MKKFLFIHVPKTAGSTLKVFFKDLLGDFFIQANSADQLAQGDDHLGPVKDLADIKRILATHTGLALHVDSSFDAVRRTDDFRSLTPYIFDAQNFDYFSQVTVLTMLRHPFRRFLSDYAFVRQMKDQDEGFLPDLDMSSAESYLDRVHPNSMLHFLLEYELHKPRTITRQDLERVKERIDGYPIHVGIFERFNESVAMFARVLDRDFTAAEVPVRNAGKDPPAVDSALEAAFLGRHALDMELYDYAVRVFERSR
jgi:hypothetical protein